MLGQPQSKFKPTGRSVSEETTPRLPHFVSPLSPPKIFSHFNGQNSLVLRNPYGLREKSVTKSILRDHDKPQAPNRRQWQRRNPPNPTKYLSVSSSASPTAEARNKHRRRNHSRSQTKTKAPRFSTDYLQPEHARQWKELKKGYPTLEI